MNQLELNKKVADAYGVDAERYEYSEMKFYGGIAENNQQVKYHPLNEDILTLFRLCIEHNFDVCCNEKDTTIVGKNDKGFFRVDLNHKDHLTKEAATCAAMFAALAKLKGIENEL